MHFYCGDLLKNNVDQINVDFPKEVTLGKPLQFEA